MRSLRRFLLVASVLLAATGLVHSVASNAGGAPSNAAVNGCTCHNMAPDLSVGVALAGLPDAYAPNQTYDLEFGIKGGPMPIMGVSRNQGGLAVRVSAGTLKADSWAKIESGTFLTHTANGNDQRSWKFQWVAPDASAGNVTFNFAGNAVNGDGLDEGGLDHWNKGQTVVGPAPANGTASPAPTERTETPSIGWPVGIVGLGVGVVLARRRD